MNKISIVKSFLLSLFCLLFSLSFAQSVDEPVGCVPHAIVLTPPPGLSSHFWEFSNGGTSDSTNAERLYSLPGEYFIVLREVEGGPVIGDTVRVEVYEKPELVIDVSKPTSCLPANIVLTNTTTYPNSTIQIESYLWDFGDSEGATSISNSLSHNYSRLGTYDVSTQILTNIRNCDIQATIPGLVTVVPPPVTSFNTSPTDLIACSAPLNVNFTNTSSGEFPLTHSWDFGDGTTSTDLNPSSKSYNSNGTFPISLTSSYDFGCSSSATKTVSIGSPNAEITKSAEADCSSNTFVLSSPISGAQYEWFVNDILQSTNQAFVPNFTDFGENKVSLKLSSADGQCSDTTSISVVKDDLDVTLSSQNSFSCEPTADFNYTAVPNQENINTTWTIDNGTTFNDSLTRTFNYSYAPLVLGDVDYFNTSVTVENDLGCTVTTTVRDSIFPLNASIISLRELGDSCVPIKVDFGGDATSFSEIVSYEFTFPDGSTKKSAEDFVSFTFTEGGEFDVTLEVENENGCKDDITIEVIAGDKIPANFDINPKKHCWDEPFVLTNLVDSDLDYTYRYNTGLGPFDGDRKDVEAFNLTGRNFSEYTQIVEYNGCVNDTSSLVLIKEVDGAEALPTSNFDCADPLVYNFEGAQSTDFTTLQWDIDDVDETTNTSFTEDFLTSGTRIVSLTAQNDEGCTPHVTSLEINAVVLDLDLAISNDQVCINTATPLDASGSDFVNGNYTWFFPSNTNVARDTTSSPITSFSFNEGGIYNAFVEGADINGCRDTASISFTVYDMIPAVSADLLTICNPDTVTFTNTSTGDLPLVNWQFNYADNTDTIFIAEPANWSHIYLTAPVTGANYQTTLTVTDSLGCTETAPLQIVRYAPSSQIAITDNTTCSGDTVTVTATVNSSNVGQLEFEWDLGENGTSNSQSNDVTFGSEGTKTISLFVTEAGSNCPADDTIKAVINVQDYPVADYTTNVDGDLVLCAPLLVNFTETSTGTNLTSSWDFGDDENGALITTNPINTFQKGTFETEYIVRTSFGCRDTLLRTFDIQGPEGDLSVSKTQPICQGEVLDFMLSNLVDVDSVFWDFGDGTVKELDGTVTDLSHTYSTFSASGFPVTLILKSNTGCQLPKTLNVPIIDVVADFTINGDTVTASCLEDAVLNITDKSINAITYSWDFGDSTSSNTSGNKQITFTESGDFIIQLVVENNTENFDCVDTLQRTFTVYPVPEIMATNDTSCVGDQLQLFIVNPDPLKSYEWSMGEFLNSDTVTNPVVDIDKTTSFVATVTDTNRCINSDTATAFVIDDNGLRGLDTLIVIGDKVILPVSGSNLRNFIWTPDTLLSCTACDFPVVMPLEDASFSLNVTDKLGCFEQDYQYIINVRPETFVKLPTTFSPNSDNNNDIVFVQGWGIKELVSFEIYNRWGELIHVSNDLEQGWDGTYRGVLQNSDAYAYKVTVLDWRNETIYREGYINLIH